jgi:hypothetical protein
VSATEQEGSSVTEPGPSSCELRRIPLPETVWKFEWAVKLASCEPLNWRQKALIDVVRHLQTPAEKLCGYFPDSFSTLDFSHLAAGRTASVKCPLDDRRTFCGSVSAGNPQKVPFVLRLPPAHEEGRAVPEGRPAQRIGLEVSEEPISERCDLRRSVQVGAALASHRADGR